MSNSLGPDQVRHFVGPDLDPNCLQKLSADDTRRKRVKHTNGAANEISVLIPNAHIPPLKVHIDHWHFESQTSTNKLNAPSAYQPSSKCMKTSKKTHFIKIVFVSISINRDMVLKWKLGQLVGMGFLPLKRISFSSTSPSFDSTVITLSSDIVHKFEKLTFAGKK